MVRRPNAKLSEIAGAYTIVITPRTEQRSSNLMSFRFNLSPEAKARMHAMGREMERLYALPDRWLAEELLRLARQARRECPEALKSPFDAAYDANFVWHLVPNIAKRLGATQLQLNENRDERASTLQGQDFREFAGAYLRNISIDRLQRDGVRGAHLTACDILGRSFVNGNPVTMAVDRLIKPPPPGADQSDWIAAHMREIARIRGFDPATATWSPGLQRYKDRKVVELVRDDAPPVSQRGC